MGHCVILYTVQNIGSEIEISSRGKRLVLYSKLALNKKYVVIIYFILLHCTVLCTVQ